MEVSSDIFYENNEKNTYEKILNKIKNGEFNEVLSDFCYIKENSIILNYIYFKHIGKEETYDYILSYITKKIDEILLKNNQFVVYVNMKNLTVRDIDKHKGFICKISGVLKDKYPEKLCKCYIYNAPYIFGQIFGIVSMFIDKDTQKKIKLVVNK